MRAADWYFDFLSPFSYLQLVQFDRLPPDLEITYRPVLFAGLLGHWEHKGPAEIPAKRVHTYRWCHWYAARHGIPFRMPPAHPFNPLRPLRLAVAHDAEPALIRAVFDAIWAEGRDVSRNDEWQGLTERLAIADAEEAIARPRSRRRSGAAPRRPPSAGSSASPRLPSAASSSGASMRPIWCWTI